MQDEAAVASCSPDDRWSSRIIDRHFAMQALKVIAMKRIRIGRISMAGLQPGQWRYLVAIEKFYGKEGLRSARHRLLAPAGWSTDGILIGLLTQKSRTCATTIARRTSIGADLQAAIVAIPADY